MADDATRYRKWLEGLRKQAEMYPGKDVAVTDRCGPYTRSISRIYYLGIISESGEPVLEEGRWTLLNVGKTHRKMIIEGKNILEVRKIAENITVEPNMMYGFDKNGVDIVLPRDAKKRAADELAEMAAELKALKTPERAV